MLSIITPNLPLKYKSSLACVLIFALILRGSLKSISLSGIFIDRPASFKYFSNSLSESTSFKPVPANALLVTNDLPEPGPPARKYALNIPGS